MTPSEHMVHEDHEHAHGPDCGHVAIEHEGHVDYLHDGHLHHPHGDHVDEHVLEVSVTNPNACTPEHRCSGHDDVHVHGATAATPRFLTATTWTISSATISIIRTAITATATESWPFVVESTQEP